MPKQITAEDVVAAESELVDAKKKKDPKWRDEASQKANDLRSAFRAQEEAAGRRSPGVGVVAENGA